ncbi:MAG: aldehyde dehydrogenase family protein, partial [Crocinitomicaceae bacterium]
MTATATMTEIQEILETLGIESINNGASTGGKWFKTRGEKIDSYSPVDGKLIASVNAASEADYEAVILKAQEAFLEWRLIPAPKRGEIVRQLAEKIREYKEPLGKLVSYEMGKSLQEGL